MVALILLSMLLLEKPTVNVAAAATQPAEEQPAQLQGPFVVNLPLRVRYTAEVEFPQQKSGEEAMRELDKQDGGGAADAKHTVVARAARVGVEGIVEHSGSWLRRERRFLPREAGAKTAAGFPESDVFVFKDGFSERADIYDRDKDTNRVTAQTSRAALEIMPETFIVVDALPHLLGWMYLSPAQPRLLNLADPETKKDLKIQDNEIVLGQVVSGRQRWTFGPQSKVIPQEYVFEQQANPDAPRWMFVARVEEWGDVDGKLVAGGKFPERISAKSYGLYKDGSTKMISVQDIAVLAAEPAKADLRIRWESNTDIIYTDSNKPAAVHTFIVPNDDFVLPTDGFPKKDGGV